MPGHEQRQGPNGRCSADAHAATAAVVESPLAVCQMKCRAFKWPTISRELVRTAVLVVSASACELLVGPMGPKAAAHLKLANTLGGIFQLLMQLQR